MSEPADQPGGWVAWLLVASTQGSWQETHRWLHDTLRATMVDQFLFGDPNLGAALADALPQLEAAPPDHPWVPQIWDAPRAGDFVYLCRREQLQPCPACGHPTRRESLLEARAWSSDERDPTGSVCPRCAHMSRRRR